MSIELEHLAFTADQPGDTKTLDGYYLDKPTEGRYVNPLEFILRSGSVDFADQHVSEPDTCLETLDKRFGITAARAALQYDWTSVSFTSKVVGYDPTMVEDYASITNNTVDEVQKQIRELVGIKHYVTAIQPFYKPINHRPDVLASDLPAVEDLPSLILRISSLGADSHTCESNVYFAPREAGHQGPFLIGYDFSNDEREVGLGALGSDDLRTFRALAHGFAGAVVAKVAQDIETPRFQTSLLVDEQPTAA